MANPTTGYIADIVNLACATVNDDEDWKAVAFVLASWAARRDLDLASAYIDAAREMQHRCADIFTGNSMISMRDARDAILRLSLEAKGKRYGD
jgi:hypothetical protein